MASKKGKKAGTKLRGERACESAASAGDARMIQLKKEKKKES